MEHDPSLKDIYTKLCKVEVILTGNGNPENGLIIKVDRLRQAQKSRDRLFWLIMGSLLTPSTLFSAYVFFTR